MKPSLRLLLVVLLVAIVAGPATGFCSDQAGASSQKTYGLEFRGSFLTVPGIIPSVSNLPDSFRQVPGHPDDFPGRQPPVFTIPDGTLRPGKFASFGLTVAPEVSWRNKYSVRGGLAWAILPYAPSPQIDNRNLQEINLNGQPDRGTSSLVYYGAKSTTDPLPGFMVEVERKMVPGIAVLAGFSMQNFRLDIQRGNDRFNQLTPRDRVRLATSHLYSPYVAVRLGRTEFGNPSSGLLVFAGPAFAQTNLSAAASGTSLEFAAARVMLGLAFFVRFDVRKQ